VRTLFIINDPPYGNERSYNALRLAGALAKKGVDELRVFLMGDASACARSGQTVAEGYYNINRMLRVVTLTNVPVSVCGTCMDARGIRQDDLVEGTRRSTMDELAEWTGWAEKVVVF
jgi:uncharacterized protein involved in oxidation of intracellular sulfur